MNNINAQILDKELNSMPELNCLRLQFKPCDKD
jgi:hypothetical protein